MCPNACGQFLPGLSLPGFPSPFSCGPVHVKTEPMEDSGMYTDAFRIKYLAGYHWTPFFVLLQKEWGSPFHVKPIQFFSKLRTERNFFNLIFKKIYILNGEKLESLLLRSETRQVYPVSPLLYKLVLEVLTNAIDKKRYTGWERRNKTVFVHMQHDCLCRKSQRITQKMGIRALINLQWGLICRMVIFYSNSRKEPSNSVNTGNLMLLNRYICGQNIFLIIFKLEPDCKMSKKVLRTHLEIWLDLDIEQCFHF